MLIGASGLALSPQAQAATTLDVVSGYNSAPFKYGFGTGGTNFTQFMTNYAGGCFGEATFNCHANFSPSNLPLVGKNIGASTFTFSAIPVPNNVIFLHPGASVGEDAILRFTAAVADTYLLNGNFSRLDPFVTPNGGQDGVLASIFKGSGSTYTSLYSNVLTGSLGSSVGFTGLSTSLAAGDYIDFVVNRRTAFNTDSTGLQATISFGAVAGAVPEPATWAMMIVGFGLIGGAMRRRSGLGTSAMA
jgi:hypothetical protein